MIEEQRIFNIYFTNIYIWTFLDFRLKYYIIWHTDNDLSTEKELWSEDDYKIILWNIKCFVKIYWLNNKKMKNLKEFIKS